MFLTSLLLGYIIGSIPFGLLLTKLAGYGDIRNIGSGNIGATNVLRTGNKKLAAVTLLLDGAKGLTAIYLVDWLEFLTYKSSDLAACEKIITGHPSWHSICISGAGYGHKPEFSASSVVLLAGLATIIGHCFPIWLKFKGGKGVATALGVFLAGTLIAGLATCAIWLTTAFLFRISSLASLIAMASAPIVTYLIHGPEPAIITLLISALVIARHHQNIRRLLKGEEPRIGEKKSLSLQGEGSARSAQGEGE